MPPPRENAKYAESPYFSRILAFPTKSVGFDNVHFVTFAFFGNIALCLKAFPMTAWNYGSLADVKISTS